MSKNGMIPGQTPYTETEQKQVRALVGQAAAGDPGEMDEHGFLPQHKCKHCGRKLNADGEHPAELYAGTYNGLCYSCERAGPTVVSTDDFGACRVSHPPSCPSWRRDREFFTWFRGCVKCNRGAVYVSRPDSQGGGYNIQCPDCSARYNRLVDSIGG